MKVVRMHKVRYTKTTGAAEVLFIFILGFLCLSGIGAIGNETYLANNETTITGAESKAIILKMLEKYDGDVKPLGENGTRTTVVSIDLYLQSIDVADDETMQWKTQFTIKLQWNDPRLQFDKDISYITLSKTLWDRIWKPMISFPNQLEINSQGALEKTEEFVRVSPNGDVLYSTRMSLSLSCPMNWRKFPFDTNTAVLKITSFGYTEEDIQFKWKDQDPVQIPSDIHITKLMLTNLTTYRCEAKTNTGTYSCLQLDIKFIRGIARYIQNFYFPIFASVTLSWMTFWLHPIKSAIPRSILLAISFFYFKSTVAETKEGIRFPTLYCTFQDYWIVWCSLFLCWAIIEYAFVSYLSVKRFYKIQTIRRTNEAEGESNQDQNNPEGTHKVILKDVMLTNFQRLGWPKTIDMITRILYPMGFSFFFSMYLACILCKDDDGN